MPISQVAQAPAQYQAVTHATQPGQPARGIPLSLEGYRELEPIASTLDTKGSRDGVERSRRKRRADFQGPGALQLPSAAAQVPAIFL